MHSDIYETPQTTSSYSDTQCTLYRIAPLSGINPVWQLEVVQSQLYFQGTATPAYTLPERSRKRRNCPVHRYFAYTRYLIAMKEVQELPVMLPMQLLYM